MNDAALKGLRMVAASMVTVTRTPEGYEVRVGARLVGVVRADGGAIELASYETGGEGARTGTQYA